MPVFSPLRAVGSVNISQVLSRVIKVLTGFLLFRVHEITALLLNRETRDMDSIVRKAFRRLVC